jgi:myo-inositol 2-dehydrogenase/D-chiro-inositol 1-dehydrogenase
MPAKLKIAIAGLGRMGARHAQHFAHLTPRAELVAASSPEPTELAWAEAHLEGVRTYLSFDDMLDREVADGLQAVVVASATTVHAEQAIKAIERGLHVLCEKPLSTGVEQVSLYVFDWVFAQEPATQSAACILVGCYNL